MFRLFRANGCSKLARRSFSLTEPGRSSGSSVDRAKAVGALLLPGRRRRMRLDADRGHRALTLRAAATRRRNVGMTSASNHGLRRSQMLFRGLGWGRGMVAGP